MRKELKSMLQLNQLIAFAAIQDATHGTLKITDNEVEFESNGAFKILEIIFKGNVFIYNELPNGYHIHIKEQRIKIINLLGLSLNDKGSLFTFEGKFNVLKCNVKTFQRQSISIDISDTNQAQLIGSSETKVEDDTLLLLDEPDYLFATSNLSNKNQVNDDTIRGLYSKKPFPNGYSGYYNYSSKNKLYTTKKGTPILNPSLVMSKSYINKTKRKVSSSRSLNKYKQVDKVVYEKQEDISVKRPNAKLTSSTKSIEKIKRGK